MKTENTTTDFLNYEFKTKKGNVTISFEDVEQNPKFRIQGPKEIISKAIAGLGEENKTEAWATEEHLKTESQRMFAVLETIKIANESEL
jgi:hypothetical protein